MQGHEIKTPLEFFNACKKLDSSIVFEFCTNEDVQLGEEILKNRYENVKIKTISGTTKYHAFIPSDTQTINAKTDSFSRLSKAFVIAVPRP